MHWIPYKKGGGYMADNVSDFKELVRDIESKKILLPDFQRDFVWKDEEKRGCGRFLGPELSNSKTASILHRTQTP